jgi:acetylornithine deacetylase/succinyl-diaminopimelate desuccinylase-like protein
MIEQVRDVDAALYLHPAETGRGLRDIKCESRGVVDVALRISGWAGSEEEPGNPESVPPDCCGNALAACVAVVERWRQTAPAGCAINLGALHGGDGPGTAALSAAARVRLIFGEPLTVDQVMTWLDREASAAVATLPRGSGDHECRARIAVDGLRANPAATAIHDRWYETVSSAVAAVTGNNPQPYGGHLCSDIRFPIRLLGVPCVGIGPAAGNFQSPDEWVDVTDLVRTVAATVLALRRFEKESPCPGR